MKSDIIIIGAGIVGLATALSILEKNPKLKIVILEKENRVAFHQTGHNSGVIHSGIYYKTGSLKATNTRLGYEKLLNFCDEHKIKYEICGKVIVATKEEEIPYLNILFERGKANGLQNLEYLDEKSIKNYEPNVAGIKGIYVPQTGIINYTSVSEKYAEIIEQKGSEIYFNQKVIGISENPNSIEVFTQNGKFYADKLISCSGLFSDRISQMTQEKIDLRIIPFRGEYYKLSEQKKNLVRNLVYPVPDPNFPFLGVHFTRMISGEVEAGPNAVLSFKREGYNKTDFNLNDTLETFSWPGFRKVAKKYWKVGIGEFYRSFNKKAFVSALQKLIPSIQEEDLTLGGSGIRAQACKINGELLDDFAILQDKNVVHVLNAPSPAATASLAIGEKIANFLG